MHNQITNPETLRKRNSKANETTEQREARLARDRERKRQKRASETDETREARLAGTREKRSQKKSMETNEERERRLSREKERKRAARERASERNRNEARQADTERNLRANERENDNLDVHIGPNSATTISENEHHLLQGFRENMDNIKFNVCNVCNERIANMKFYGEVCKRCYTDKNNADKNHVKKFSAAKFQKNSKDLPKLKKCL